MTILKLIGKLKDALEEEGDIEVRYMSDTSVPNEIEEVEVRPGGEHEDPYVYLW